MRLTPSAIPLPIGVDIGAFGVRMLQLAIVNDVPQVVAAARHAWSDAQREVTGLGRTPSPLEVSSTLKQLTTQGQFRGREIVLSLPRDLVQVKNLRFPVMPVEDLIQAAEMEAHAIFGSNDVASTIQVIPAGEVRHGNDVRQEVVAVCTRNADVDALVEAWHHAGFRPAGLDFEPIALYRAVERFVRRRDDEAEVNVLVDIGARRTTVLIGRGRELNFFKAFEIGGTMLTHAVSRKLGISFTDAATLRTRLADTFAQTSTIGTDPVRQAVVDSIRPICEDVARELALCLRYYSVNFRGQRPSRVRVVGGESADPTVIKLLSNALPVPVEPGKPVANADCSLMKAADRAEAMGEWTHAFGLALKRTKGTFPDRSGTSRAARGPTDRVIDVTMGASADASLNNALTSSASTSASTTRIEINADVDPLILNAAAAASGSKEAVRA